MTAGFVDLHCHYIPAVDDGVRTAEEGRELLRELAALGYAQVVATPHIRTAMFDNRPQPLREAFEGFRGTLDAASEYPLTGLAAEHYFDDVFWELRAQGEILPYPGGHAALIEFHYEQWPVEVQRRLFELRLSGIRPVIAHPERYHALFDTSDRLDPLLDGGAVGLLDLMSLVGHYGRKPQGAAERMVDEGAYYAACSDCHRPGDVERVAKAIDRLRALVGKEESSLMLCDHPRLILTGQVPD